MDEQDSEFVAAEARYDVALPHSAREQPSNLDQSLVAGLVAERIVDVFEAIEVNEQHRGILTVALDAIDNSLEGAHEAAAVGKVDEEVLVRQPVELLTPLLKLRDLAAKQADFLNETLDVSDVGDLVRHCPRAFALACIRSHSAIPNR
jgi:hypothetical protein